MLLESWHLRKHTTCEGWQPHPDANTGSTDLKGIPFPLIVFYTQLIFLGPLMMMVPWPLVRLCKVHFFQCLQLLQDVSIYQRIITVYVLCTCHPSIWRTASLMVPQASEWHLPDAYKDWTPQIQHIFLFHFIHPIPQGSPFKFIFAHYQAKQ